MEYIVKYFTLDDPRSDAFDHEATPLPIVVEHEFRRLVAEKCVSRREKLLAARILKEINGTVIRIPPV